MKDLGFCGESDYGFGGAGIPIHYICPKNCLDCPPDVSVSDDYRFQDPGFVPYGGPKCQPSGEGSTESTCPDKSFTSSAYLLTVPLITLFLFL
jgi:hypothetical protein